MCATQVTFCLERCQMLERSFKIKQIIFKADFTIFSYVSSHVSKLAHRKNTKLTQKS